MSAFKNYRYCLTKNGRLLDERVTIESIKPRKRTLDLANTQTQALLLEKFLNVTDEKTLVAYANNYGLPFQHDEGIREMIDLNINRPGQNIQIIREPHYFLDMASALRWLSSLTFAVSDHSHDDLESWIKPTEALEDSFLPWVTITSSPMIRLVFRLQKKSPEYGNWLRARTILKPHKFLIAVEKFRGSAFEKKGRHNFAKSYLAFQLNSLVEGVSPAVTEDGKPTYTISNQLDAMALLLLNQFAGAAGVSICRNPNCPNRYYLAKKSKRKQRSDRQYCDRPGCQKWGVTNLGRVRSSYGER